ncbi:hypothetical protein BCR44DRAFT_35341 [Catenaria anguillulae PL171]|uniref:Uncharacterized protein n=1 Tax=Catenaria anguillulae PL171 TaxID=765915 RepID=A0A1Y2HWL8_9FUNG|nr:hypothetical protein BCR44DRAFT_35341 [Catenaria anguillulae PL171]
MNQFKHSHSEHPTAARPQRHGRQQQPLPASPSGLTSRNAGSRKDRSLQPTANQSVKTDSKDKGSRDQLEFYSQSPDVPPGQGRGEHVRNPSEYTALASIQCWRNVLSNFHMSEFQWMGYTWPSVEHAYQGAKMLVCSRDAFIAFSKEGKVQPDTRKDGMNLEQAVFGIQAAEEIEEMREQAEMMQRMARPPAKGRGRGASVAAAQGARIWSTGSGSGSGYPHIGADTSLAARQARKLVPLSIDQAEFWSRMSQSVMLSISRAKYAQSPLSQRILLATNEAELWHRVEVDDPRVRFDHLEAIRVELRVQSKSR